MINPEWVKNMRSLLSEAVESSDKNPSIEKLLEMANIAAKQLKNSASSPVTPSFSEEENKDKESTAETATLNSTIITIKKIDELVTSLGKLLEMANSTVKQISAIEPILPTFLKGQSRSGQSNNSSSDGKLNSSGSGHGFTTLIFLLLIVIIPIFLRNFAFGF